MRAGGTVRFILITTRMQLMALCAVATIIALWGAGTGVMLWRQASVAAAQSALAAQRSVVNSEAARASADRHSVEAVAQDLEQRQDALDALVDSHFGGEIDQDRLVGKDEVGKDEPAKAGTAKKTIGSAQPLSGTARFALLRQRQQMFTRTLTEAATERVAKVEAAIRSVGLKPAQLAAGGQGGPFEPVTKNAVLSNDAQLRSLADLLNHLSALESALTVLPSGRPTMTPMLTSSYGYRRDPFNGMLAFHAGLDFPGAYGQPILAASSGKIIFAGQKSGYGNCVEIDHGHGIVTRYAHLSGFNAHAGDKVRRGQQIARMGSTGRSTGTHLHFEVRVNGAAVNPRPFLEAKQDVLETQQEAARWAQHTSDRG